jgi:hypothetical protein
MFEPIQEATENFQKVSKDNYDAVLRSYGELNKGFQAVAARWIDFSKRSFEGATRAFEQLVGAKSLGHDGTLRPGGMSPSRNLRRSPAN